MLIRRDVLPRDLGPMRDNPLIGTNVLVIFTFLEQTSLPHSMAPLALPCNAFDLRVTAFVPLSMGSALKGLECNREVV